MKLVEVGPDPLFSVVFCAASTLTQAKRNLAAIQAQSRGSFELVVASPESTGPSIEFLRQAAQSDPRIRLFPKTPTNPGERLLFALRQCRGRYIAICPGNASFAPDAFEFVAGEFRRDPDAGGLCGSGFLIDASGGSLSNVDIVTLLLSSYRPCIPSGFINRQALVACGLNSDAWFVDSIELEIWCRLATEFGLRSTNHKMIEGDKLRLDLIAPPQDLERGIQARLDLVAGLFSKDGFFEGTHTSLMLEAQINQLSTMREHADVFGASQADSAFTNHLQDVVDELRTLLMSDHRVLHSLDRLAGNRAHALGFLSRPLRVFLALLKRMQGRPPIHAGYSLWNFPSLGPWLTRTMFVKGLPASEFDTSAARSAMLADVYAMVGSLYDSRGQVGLALTMWERARRPNDLVVDSLACQALLKVPGLSDAALAERQRRWIAPHVRDLRVVAPKAARAPEGKIRIGYHCAFMNSDTIRFTMRNVIAAHDRTHFEVFGYSSQRLVEGRTPSFDAFRHTPALHELVGDPPAVGERLDDNAFANLVRNDRLDIFVELSGFTPGHRLTAMGRRLAPVQVSHLNHLGSSQVPNVDYLLSDERATPSVSDSQQYYSESLYRLPGCFLSYDYTASNEPPIVDPPSIRNSFVTFGYFGSGAKLNIQVIEVWASLLHRVPNAKLHIQNFQLASPASRRLLADRFRRFGISSDRLIIGAGIERASLMRVYGGIDISLDTWPYCGGNTIAESLWQGVPVITWKGDRFVSAYGSSLVRAAGCPELATDTLDQYVETASRLANDPERLLFLRHNLRRMSIENGLADSVGFARRLEAAYTDMLRRLDDAAANPHGSAVAKTFGVAVAS